MSVLMRASDKRFVGRIERIADRVKVLQEPIVEEPSTFHPKADAWGELTEARLDLSMIIARMERDHHDTGYAWHAWELLDLAIVVLARSTPKGLSHISRDVAVELIQRVVAVLRAEEAE